MNGKRLAAASVVAAAALALFASPVLAQGGDSITEQLISGLNARLLAVALPITLVVEGILFYTVWKFKDNDEPEPTKENRRLEITWTVATAIVLLFVGVASYGVMANPNVVATGETLPADGDAAGAGDAAADPVVVEATGVQWFWRFHYPEHNVSTQGEMVIPVDRPIVVKTTSSDVVHSFHVPALSLKQDALPGQWNYIRTEVYEPGTYRLYCAEYCGTGHSQMLGNVTVTTETGYRSWLDEQANDTSGGNTTAPA
jgi:cytochrome c oxidase subunit 2